VLRSRCTTGHNGAVRHAVRKIRPSADSIFIINLVDATSRTGKSTTSTLTRVRLSSVDNECRREACASTRCDVLCYEYNDINRMSSRRRSNWLAEQIERERQTEKRTDRVNICGYLSSMKTKENNRQRRTSRDAQREEEEEYDDGRESRTRDAARNIHSQVKFARADHCRTRYICYFGSVLCASRFS
jgi:hypothetical protein